MYKLYILLTEIDWKMSERENQERRQQDFEKIIEKIIDNAEIGLKEFYEKECGKGNIIANCIGHTHIDVAWFWTVMQTKEKAQRSFSTVINMMKRLDNIMNVCCYLKHLKCH